MNSRKLLFLAGLLFSSAIGRAQSLQLPYAVDWTDDLNDGWQVFIKGDGIATYSWSFNQCAARGGYAGEFYATGHINHIDDWTVSPALDLFSGANVSFSFRVGNALNEEILPGDSVQLYILTGNADPALATKTLLGNINADGAETVRDTSIYMLPANTVSYIAFRYTAITDSNFSSSIFNLKVKSAPTSVSNINKGGELLRIYPNPATDRIYWSRSANVMPETYAIVDMSGRVIMPVNDKTNNADISHLAKGAYILKTGDDALPFVKK